jgi:hypothetical protein
MFIYMFKNSYKFEYLSASSSGSNTGITEEIPEDVGRVAQSV